MNDSVVSYVTRMRRRFKSIGQKYWYFSNAAIDRRNLSLQISTIYDTCVFVFFFSFFFFFLYTFFSFLFFFVSSRRRAREHFLDTPFESQLYFGTFILRTSRTNGEKYKFLTFHRRQLRTFKITVPYFVSSSDGRRALLRNSMARARFVYTGDDRWE